MVSEKPNLTPEELVGHYVMVKHSDLAVQRAFVLGAADATTVQVRTDNGSLFHAELTEIVGVAPWNKMQVKAQRVPGAADDVREMLDALRAIDAQLDRIRQRADKVFPQCAMLDSDTFGAGWCLTTPEHVGRNPELPCRGGDPITATRMEAQSLRAVVHQVFGAFVALNEAKGSEG